MVHCVLYHAGPSLLLLLLLYTTLGCLRSEVRFGGLTRSVQWEIGLVGDRFNGRSVQWEIGSMGDVRWNKIIRGLAVFHRSSMTKASYCFLILLYCCIISSTHITGALL